MLKNMSGIVLEQLNAKCWTDVSTWTYNSTNGSTTVTVFTASTLGVGEFVSLNPNGGGFTAQIAEVLTITPGVSFTVSVMGTTATVVGGTFTSSGEIPVFNYTIKGGTLNKNSTIRVFGRISHTSSANAKKVRVKLGGTTLHAIGTASVGVLGGVFEASISNRNSTSKQIGTYNDTSQAGSYAINLGAGLPTGTVDTTVNQVLSVTLEKATTTEALNLESIMVIHYLGTR